MSQNFPTTPQLIPQKEFICTFCGKCFTSESEKDFHKVVDCDNAPNSNIEKTQVAQTRSQPPEKANTASYHDPQPPRYDRVPTPYIIHSPPPLHGLPPQFRGCIPLQISEEQKWKKKSGAEGLITLPKIMLDSRTETMQPTQLTSRRSMNSVEKTVSVAEVDTELCRVKLGGLIRGYKCEILTENLSERELNTFKCPKCGGIMKDCSISKKGEQLCFWCLKKGEHSLSNESIRVTISSLKCSCPLSKRGCDWLGILGNVEQHLKTCGLVNLSCKLMCGAVTRRGKMGRHLKELCSERKMSCLHCWGIHKACRMEEHVKVCGKVQVLCELGCGEQLLRESMKLHKEIECLEGIVVCPYAEYNCKVTGLKRRELTQHMENSRITHLELKFNTLEEETQLKTIESQMKLQELEDLTNLKILDLENANIFLIKKLEDFETQIETKNQEIIFLKEEVLVKEEATVKWNIKNIPNHFRPKPSPDPTYSDFFVVVGYKFRLCHSCDDQDFKIGFRLTKAYYHDSLKWPLNVIFLTRIIHQSDSKRSLNYKSSKEEINKEDYTYNYPKQICHIPLYTNLNYFVRSDSLDVEVTIRILKH